MTQKHLKRMASPKSWNVIRKNSKFIIKPSSGPHSVSYGIPLGVLLRESLGYSSTLRESKKMLNSSEVTVNGKIRKDFKFPVGMFDTIEFARSNEFFRAILNKKGKIDLIKIKKDESMLKPSKVTGKTMVNGKLQLNLYDGTNIIVSNKDYLVGDTVLLALNPIKIIKHFKLAKKNTIYLTGGKHIGEIGHVEDVARNKIIYKDENESLVETSKSYAFVVGDNKPAVTLKQNGYHEKN